MMKKDYFAGLLTTVNYNDTEYMITGDTRNFHAYRQNDGISLELNDSEFPLELKFWKIGGKVHFHPDQNKSLGQKIISEIEETLLLKKINWVNYNSFPLN